MRACENDHHFDPPQHHWGSLPNSGNSGRSPLALSLDTAMVVEKGATKTELATSRKETNVYLPLWTIIAQAIVQTANLLVFKWTAVKERIGRK